MSQDNNHPMNDRAELLLEKVIEGFRHRVVPSSPRLTVVFPSSKLSTPANAERSVWAKVFVNRLVHVSSVAILILAVLTVGSMVTSKQSVAFGQVKEALGKVLSYEFQRDFAHGISERVMVLDEFRSRRERKGVFGNEITVLDWKQQRALVLDPEKRTARIKAIYPSPDVMARLKDAASHFKRVPERATRRIGDKKLDGVNVVEFAVEDDDGEQVVAIDVESKLPVRTDWIGMKGAPPGMKIVDSNYDFEPIFDEALFSLTPPAGYAVDQRVEPQGPQPTDEELRSLIVSPEGIGKVTFGMTKNQVVQLFGTPDGVEPTEVPAPSDPVLEGQLGEQVVLEAKRLPAEKLLYNSRGFQMVVSDMFGLETVECFGPPLSGMFIRDFPGKTSEGTRMGAARKEIFDKYGDPNVQVPVSRIGEETLGYHVPDAGSATISFRLRDGSVCGMTFGKRIANKPKAGDQDQVERAQDAASKTESVEGALTDADPHTAEIKFAALVAEYQQELQGLRSQAREQVDVARRQALVSRNLHLPERYAEHFLALAEQYAPGATSLDACRWVIVNVVDLSHPSVSQAVTCAIKHHSTSSSLEDVIMRARFGGKECEELLRTILADNPDRSMRGLACFALGQHLVHHATNTVFTPGNRSEGRFVIASAEKRTRQTADAEQLFERVVNDYSDVQWRSRDLGELADAFLKSLRSPVATGKHAPEIDAPSASGDGLRLSDFRGRVVVLQFSANWCAPCKAMYPKLRELDQQYADNRFVVLGVMADASVDTVLAAQQKGDITWPVWHDGMEGPIASAWAIRGFPTVILIDADGVIVNRGHQLDLEKIHTLVPRLSDR